jgi:hypothetical protein
MTEKLTGKIRQQFLAQFLIASLLGVLLKPKQTTLEDQSGMIRT